MNKDLHHIDDLFKSSIDGHLEEVPPDVWNNVDHSLDKKQAAFYKKKYFAVRAAAILLILVGGATIAAILHFNQREKISSVNTASERPKERSDKGKESPSKNEASKDLAADRKSQKVRNTVLNNSQGNTKGNELEDIKPDHKKGKSKKYAVVNIENYTARENEEVTSVHKNKRSTKQDETVKHEPVIKSSIGLAAGKRQNSNGRLAIEQAGISITQPEPKEIQRTTHVDGNLLGTGGVNLITSLTPNSLHGAPISLSAPSSNPKNIRLRNHFKSWSISATYAQNINLNTLRDDDQIRDPRNNSREAKRTEQENSSFSMGLGLRKMIGSNISLQSGIQYFSSETNIQPRTIFAEPDARGDVRFRFSCSSGESYLPTKTGTPPINGDSIKTNFSRSEISYLQVPLLFSYAINFGRFSLMPSAGIQSNFLLHGKLNSFLEHPTGEEEVSGSIDGLRSMYFSGVLQPQLNYKLSDRVSFDFNPNINFSLSPINKETAVKTYQNMFSIGAGVRIKL